MSKKKNPLPWYDLHSSACWQKKRNQNLLASPPLSVSRVIVTSSSYIACQSYLVSCNLFFECLFISQCLIFVFVSKAHVGVVVMVCICWHNGKPVTKMTTMIPSQQQSFHNQPAIFI